MGESPRWHDGRLWVADMGASEVVVVDLDGTSEVVARVLVEHHDNFGALRRFNGIPIACQRRS